MQRPPLLITLLAAPFLAASATGQTPGIEEAAGAIRNPFSPLEKLMPLDLNLKPIEQGTEDADPLATSLRDARIDLRSPAAFDRVYQVPGRPDLLMRVEGALYAVFPQSTYTRTKVSVLPSIPTATIFYIGDRGLAAAFDRPQAPQSRAAGQGGSFPAWANALESRMELRSGPQRIGDLAENGAGATRVDTSAPPTPEDQTPAVNPARPAPANRPTILTDERYRARRIRALMQRAAEIADGRGQAARGPGSSSK